MCFFFSFWFFFFFFFVFFGAKKGGREELFSEAPHNLSAHVMHTLLSKRSVGCVNGTIAGIECLRKVKWIRGVEE